MRNANLSQHKLWHRHENWLIKTILTHTPDLQTTEYNNCANVDVNFESNTAAEKLRSVLPSLSFFLATLFLPSVTLLVLDKTIIPLNRY